MQQALRRPAAGLGPEQYNELGQLFAEFLDRGFQIYSGGRSARPQWPPDDICITGASLGTARRRTRFRRFQCRAHPARRCIHQADSHGICARQWSKRTSRAWSKPNGGEGRFESIESIDRCDQACARVPNDLDLGARFRFSRGPAGGARSRHASWPSAPASTRCAMPEFPLVMRYKTTTKGTKLPDRWMLPDEIRDDTGILFTSAFPGYDSYERDHLRLLQGSHPARTPEGT